MFSRRELLLLRAMYQHGTVTAAAASINMSQPAASALLRDLDTRLGFALFTREKRRLVLTSQGRAIMQEVLNALAGIEAVDRLALDIRQGAQGRLTVAAVPIAATILLPAALHGVQARHPDVTVTAKAGTALEIVDMAVDHRIDIGIIIGPLPDNARVATARLAPLSLYAVLRRDHPLAKRRALTLAMVAETRPIVLALPLPAGRATRHIMQIHQLDYRPSIEVAQSPTACALVAQGLGVAIVESLGARYAERQGLLVRHLVFLDEPVLALVWPKDRALSEPALALRQALFDGAALAESLPR
jgi:DNA-binding transcriptional LysR family regulator